MEFKGTKGTWWVSGTEIISDFYTKIAKVHPTNMNDYNEHKHNAQLMAKAPEMLDLLEDILKCIDYHEMDSDNKSHYKQKIIELIKEVTEL